ncbi:MAG: ClpP family protease [Brevundimonas sp.]|uniref:ClpP family protease n=1 Tax=Brevundimonas sp. TaxID=1871086 RepID=UPI00391A2180
MTKAVPKGVLTAESFDTPRILLAGAVDYAMYDRFRDQLADAPKTGLTVIELSTLGGDPEVARMMGEDVRFQSDINPSRRLVFLGKAAIYSAGATFMSFFAVENRYLTRGARVMIHERKMDRTLHVTGPLTTCIASVRAMLNELEHSIAIQNEGFENLVRGSSVTMEDVLRRAPANWYIEAQEAKALGLIAEVI